ncbi:MAG: 2-C-methyl-D-erythritol 4-phosphate cytidylyltransferase [Gammaproteobacteria bacterium]|nr:2-C-methyl-D-erythritol 4-phosphate cytidylyltransferase [Gammaproteobacteria bacterium]MDP2140971.1 2-C-methyl-D-erythritol 4-phosphate cytidylyltransferase [Gammaproteobacteria bacterium]MDP2349285.1 2-C-methyl-D-erythritol 4-phosphate cytidylyltransferase [Gammaproteobacteria bacterium]
MAIWAIVPAAGVGARMMAATPKQYLLINGKSVIAHTVERLLSVTEIDRVVIATHPQDTLWGSLGATTNSRVTTCVGGSDRCQSVLNALLCLEKVAEERDWVLVHDAVRPCVRKDDIEVLLCEIEQHSVGGLLAMPVSSTLKRAGADGNIAATVDRSDMWLAATPQAFRYGRLLTALKNAITNGSLVTDEASAMELAGFAPKLVRCRADNIKITYSEDLLLAGLIMTAQESE